MMEFELEEKSDVDPSAGDTSEEELDGSANSEEHPSKKSFVIDCLSDTTRDAGGNDCRRGGTCPQSHGGPKQTFDWGNPAQNGSYSVFDLEKGNPIHAFARIGDSAAHDEVIRSSDVLGDPFLLREASGEKKKASSPVECGACGKSFLQKNSLISHLRLHTGERPFMCHVCEKSFTQKNVLDSHLRLHTGERPFVCHVCGKGHAKDGDLKRHVRTHTGEKPYTCDVCKKAFSQSAHLKVHLRMHSNEKPFSCAVCHKTFARNYHLKVHSLTHTKEKRFACDKCDKAFSLNTHLTRHQRTHTGDRPFVCNVCDKAFFRRDRMKEHIRNHHASENSVTPADR